MSRSKIAFERCGNVATIRLNDPATLNALDRVMIEEVDAALDEAAGSARALILTGAGRGFCTGAGLAAAGELPVEEAGPDFGAVLETLINPLMTKLRDMPIPWITAVRGPAAGAGCALALAGDMVVASDTAYFLQAFARIGLVPDAGSTHLLARGATRVRAMEMMLLGERIAAATALEWGLVNRVVSDAELEGVAAELAERLAAGPTRSLGLIRRAAWDALDDGWHAALAAERDAQRIAGRTRDAGEGIRAFLEKRAPDFEGK